MTFELRAGKALDRRWLFGAVLLVAAVLVIEALRPATSHLQLEEAQEADLVAAERAAVAGDAAIEKRSSQLLVAHQPTPEVWREVMVRDAAGRVLSGVSLAAPPRRIVSQTAASDDILLALVPAARIAALSSYSAGQATSLDLDKARQVGRFVTSNAEQILALEPDLVITAAYSAPELMSHLFAASTPVLQLQEFSGWRDIRENIEILGAAIGAETQAAQLIERGNRRLAAVGARRTRAPSVRVLAYTYGNAQARGSTFDDVLRWCAARNVATEAGLEGWSAVDLEQIAAWQPDVVFLSAERGREELERRRFLEQPVLRDTHLTAPGRVVVLSGALFGTVSHRYVDLVERVAAALDVVAPPEAVAPSSVGARQTASGNS